MDQHGCISNSLSILRIMTMFGIVAVHALQLPIYTHYSGGIDISKSYLLAESILTPADNQPWFIDKLVYLYAHCGWSLNYTFFLISGMSLWYSTRISGRFNLKDYLFSRFWGIYVPYAVAVVIIFCIGITYLNIKSSTYDLVGLLLGAAASSEYLKCYDSPLWFISLLMIFYLFFPIFPSIYKKFRLSGLLVSLAIIYAVSRWLDGFPLIARLWVGYYFLFFAAGVVVMELILSGTAHLSDRRIMNAVKVILVASVPISAYILYWSIYDQNISRLGSSFMEPRYFVAICSALIALSIGFLLPDKYEVFNNLLRKAGRATFAVYIYHFVFIQLYNTYRWKLTFIAEPLYAHVSLALFIVYILLVAAATLYQYAMDAFLLRLRKLVDKTIDLQPARKIESSSI